MYAQQQWHKGYVLVAVVPYDTIHGSGGSGNRQISGISATLESVESPNSLGHAQAVAVAKCYRHLPEDKET